MFTIIWMMLRWRRLNVWRAENPADQRIVNRWLFIAALFFAATIVMVAWTGLFHLQGQQAFRYYDRGEYSKAVPRLRWLLRLYPGMAGIDSMLGRSLLEAGQVGSAVAQYRKVVVSGRANADDHYYFGEALYAGGLRAEARTQWQEALRLADKDSDIASQAKEALEKYR